MLLFASFMALSFGLLVVLAGLLGLAYSRKEDLGKIYKWVSYLTVTCGTIVCIAAIVIASLSCCCSKSYCGPDMNKCHTEMRAHHMGDYCSKSPCNSDKKMRCKKTCKKVCDKKKVKEVNVDETTEVADSL